ncbi:MAG: 6-bladed beta-propeller [Rhodothermales bacterium]
MTFRFILTGAVLFTLLGLSACNTPDVIEERDGVLYVNNPESGLWHDRNPTPLRFELEQSFGAEEEPAAALLSSIADVVTDDQGHVYVLDRRDNRLVSFHPDGSVRWSTGREGEGPGEFYRVRGLAWDGASTLYVANLGGNRIDRFDTNGTFLKSHMLAEYDLSSVHIESFLPPHSLVLDKFAAGFVGAEVVILDVGERWEKKMEFTIDRSEGLQIPPGVGVGIDIRATADGIVAGSSHTYELQYYDLSGTLQRVVSRNVDYLMPPGIVNRSSGSSVGTYGSLGAPFRLATGHWLSRASWPTNVSDPDAQLQLQLAGNAPEVTFACSLDLFDPEGRFLLSLTWDNTSTPEIGRPVHVDTEGKLYTVLSSPHPQVRRYRVVIED